MQRQETANAVRHMAPAPPENSIDSMLMTDSAKASSDLWALCFNALKPGAHAIVNATVRNYHRTAFAIETAGFEIRDVVTHHGHRLTEQWIVTRKPAGDRTIADNVLMYKTGGINIDACRIATRGENFSVPQSDPSKRSGTVGSDLGITRSDIQTMHDAQRASIERTITLGRWPTNLVLSHSSDCEHVGTKQVASDGHWHNKRELGDGVIYNGGGLVGDKDEGNRLADEDGLETVDAWTCVRDCPVGEIDRQGGGERTSGRLDRASITAENNVYGARPKKLDGVYEQDSGMLSRFFPVFVDRSDLIRWFIKLITPVSGVLLNPIGDDSVVKASYAERFVCFTIF